MPSHKIAAKRDRRALLDVEGLEARLALSTARPVHVAEVVQALQGQVTNQQTGAGVRGVPIQLINASGRVVGRARTDASGNYQFNVAQPGAYVVRERVPRGYLQVTPTFPNVEPTGSLVPGAGSNSWNYTSTNTNPANGPVGPGAWETIAPAGSLPFESPINIATPATNLSRYLTINYQPATPSKIINNGHQIQVQFAAPAPDSVNVGGVSYHLAQFHYHAPAENTVHGRYYAAEEHFVNASADGGETVVAVFLRRGPHNAALDSILNAAISKLDAANTSTTADTTPVNFAGLLPRNMRGWFYQGSLTTPPLSQPVNWFVLATPITLDAQQMQEYAKIAGDSGFLPNNRPVQPLDGRVLNEVTYNLNVTNQPVSNLNFQLVPRGRA